MAAALEAEELTAQEIELQLTSGGVDLDVVLRKQLFDGRAHVRRNAARAALLAGEPRPSWLEALDIASKDGDPVVRGYAVEVFGHGSIPPALSMPVLWRGVADPVPTVRRVAVRCLAQLLTDRFPEAIGWVIEAIGDTRPIVQLTAVDLAVACGKRGVESLVAAMGHRRPVVRRAARDAVQRVGGGAAGTLIGALKREELRAPALLCLEKIDTFDRRHEQALLEMLKTGDVRLRVSVGRALKAVQKALERQYQRPARVAYPPFYERHLDAHELEPAKLGVDARELAFTLRDGRAVVRANAARLIPAVGLDDSTRAPVMAALAGVIRDPDPTVRFVVSDVLAGLGGTQAIMPLIVAASDREKSVAKNARDHLARLAPTHVPQILGTLGPRMAAPQLRAIREALGRAGPKAVPSLRDAIAGSGSPMVREVAARALAMIGSHGKADIQVLLGALADEHEAVRFRAAWALGRLVRDDAKVVAALQDTVRRDPSRGVRRAAYKALPLVTGVPMSKVKEPERMPVPGFDIAELKADELTTGLDLLELEQLVRLLNDGRAVVRRNAALALGLLGEKAASASDKLVLLLKDSDVSVRIAAANALGIIRPDAATCVPALAASLRRAPPELETALVRALVRYGARAVRPLIGTLSQRSHLVLTTVGRVARLFDESLAGALADCLGPSADDNVRKNAADILAMMGERGAAAAQAIVDALRVTRDAHLSSKLVRALSRVAPTLPETHQLLAYLAASDARASVAQTAERALEKMPPPKAKAKAKAKAKGKAKAS